MSEQQDESNFPPALERALSILEYLCESETPKSSKEISEELQIPIASTYRIVNCLRSNGYLRESRYFSDKFTLGYKLIALGRYAHDKFNIIEIANKHMEKLAANTAQACQLLVLDDDSVITIHQTLPLSVITVIAKIGEKIPINLSAGGTILTSLLPSARLNLFLKKAWKTVRSQTEYSILDIEEFRRKLVISREQGYAVDREEYALGIGCLAVALYDQENNPIAALGLTGHISSYEGEAFESLLKQLQVTGSQISDELRR